MCTMETLSNNDRPIGTTESLLSTEQNSEVSTSIMIHDRTSKCQNYCIEIILGSVLIMVLAGIIFIGIVILKISPIESTANESSRLLCCSKNYLRSIPLGHIRSMINNEYLWFSFNFTCRSSKAVLTFVFKKGSSFHLDNVSLRSSINGTELLADGDFETGTLGEFCSCQDGFLAPELQRASGLHGGYALELDTFFSSMIIGHNIDVVPGSNYTVSFWLKRGSGIGDAEAIIYANATQTIYDPFSIISLLPKMFFMLLTFHQIKSI